MPVLQLFFAFLFPLLVGICFINLFFNQKGDASSAERVALGLLAGLMLITAEMAYVLTGLNIKFSLLSICLPLTPIIFWGGYVTIKNKLFEFNWSFLSFLKNMSLFEKILIFLLLLNIFFVFGTVMLKPVVGVDAWANYSLRAKAYYLEGTNNLKTLPATGRGDHVALTQTWVFLCLNQWNDLLGKIFLPFFYFCLLIVFYRAARRTRPRPIALLSTLILATLPFLVYHATLEYTDLPLAVYLFAGVSLLFLWFNNPQIRYLLLSSFFLFSTITIKNEAYLYLPIIFIVFFFTIFSKKDLGSKELKQVKAISMVVAFGGGIFASLKLFSAANEFYLSPENFTRIPSLVAVFTDYLFVRNNWGLAGILLILLLLFNFKNLKKDTNLRLFLLLILFLLGIMSFYLVSRQDTFQWLFFVTPANRNLLQIMPIILLLIANLLPSYVQTGQKELRKTKKDKN